MVNRLPWVEVLPSGWVAAIWPRPVMIPVNITPFSQGMVGKVG